MRAETRRDGSGDGPAWTQRFGMVSFELFGQARNVIEHHGARFDAIVLAMARGIGLAG